MEKRMNAAETICLTDVGCYRVRLEGAYYWKGHEIPEDEPAVVYARKIVSGEYLACENEKLGCARFLYELDLMAAAALRRHRRRQW